MNEEKRKCPRLDVRQYVGRWISLHPETHEVVADGASLKEARDGAIMKGVERPLLMMVPASEGYFVGAGNPV
jgi:hypothetical protein